MALQATPTAHTVLFLKLHKALDSETFETMKYMVKADEFGGFLPGELQMIKTPRDMLEKLEQKGITRVGDYRKLKQLMEKIDMISLIDTIKDTEKELCKQGYSVASGASDDEMSPSCSYRIKTHQPQGPIPKRLQPSGDIITYTTHIHGVTNSPITVGTSIGNTTNYGSIPKRLRLSGDNITYTTGATSNPIALGTSTGNTTNYDPVQDAADKTEEALITRYKTTGSYVQMIPWVDDDKMHILDIFTKLMLQNVGGDTEKLKSYEDMFFTKTKEGNLIKRILLNVMAGIAKSTLIDKMAYDWAIRSSSVLRKYKLVFVLKMHALEQTSELIDAISNQLLDDDTPINKSDLKSYITTNPDKLLVLMDGFDEFMTTNLSETSFGSILNMLNRKTGTECCVVVTTRPSHFHTLVSKPLVENPFTHVKVLGFSEEDIEEYVIKFYSRERNKALGLTQKIQSSNVLRDLAKSPMLLLLMCLLWKEQDTIPDTMSQLYKQAIRYIFKRKADMTPEEIATVLNEIGKIALSGLLSSKNQMLSFKQSEFEKNALDTALRAGVVTSQRVKNGIDTYHSVHFSHKTFQEFCAAIYFQSLLETDSEEFDKILNQVTEFTDRHGFPALEYLLRFCCGDNEACTNKILHIMQMKMNIYMFSTELPVKCYFEGQFDNLPSVDFLTEDITIGGYSSDGLHSLFYYLKHVIDEDQKKGRGNAHLAKVQKMLLTYMKACDLQRFSEDLAYCMSRMTNITCLELKEFSLSSANMEHIASSFGCTPNLRELDISVRVETDMKEGLGGLATSWGHHLRCLKCLKKLQLRGCNIQEQDVKFLAASLGVMEKLISCSISNYMEYGTSYKLVMQYVEGYEEWHETFMRLSRCSLIATELRDILRAITTRNDLIQLDLSLNDTLGGTVNIWAPYISHLKNLHGLILNNCSLQSIDLEHIAKPLSDIPTFVSLNLSGNAALGGKSESWAHHLKQVKQLKRLDLCTCSLTDKDVKPIAELIGVLPNMVKLYLSGNETLRGSGALWDSQLRHLTHLQTLKMGDCSLTEEDKKYINKIESQLTKKPPQGRYDWLLHPQSGPNTTFFL